MRRVEAEPSQLGTLWDGCVQIFFSTPRPRARPRSPPGERSSRARSLLDRWQKQRGKTPSLAATRGHTTALGHLGCHKDKVIEPCFGRRARRAAHVSDPRRSILRSGGGGRTLSGDVEPRCSLEHAGPPKQPSPTPGATRSASWGRTLEARDAWDGWDGRVLNFFSSLFGFACVRRRPRRSVTPGGGPLGFEKKLPKIMFRHWAGGTVRIGTSLLRQLAHVEEIGHV